MPDDLGADLPEVTAFAWVPPFARGQVRDLRVRWALEELDRPYRVRLLSGPERPKDYFREHVWEPFWMDTTIATGDTNVADH